MKKYKIIYSKKAKNDLRDIVLYIDKTLNAYSTAMNMFNTIKKKIEEVSENPYLYILVKHNGIVGNIRKSIVKKHLIFFTVDEEKKQIIIIRILNGRRNWKRIL